MRVLIPIVFILIQSFSFVTLAQDDKKPSDEVSLDVLSAPVSPAATLLNIADAQVERPSDPTAFMVLLNQASGNFSSLPASFAVDLAPAWLFGGNKITLERFMENHLKTNLWQSMVVSLATTSVDSIGETTGVDPFSTKVSASLKLSLLRGDVGQETRQALDNLRKARRVVAQSFSQAVDSVLQLHSEYQSLASQQEQIMSDTTLAFSYRRLLVQEVLRRREVIRDSVQQSFQDRLSVLKEEAEKIKFVRYGFKLDFAAGLVWDFPQQNFREGSHTMTGTWLTGGWEGKKGFSALGVVRYLYSPEAIFADDEGELDATTLSTLDAGARIIYSNPLSRFSLSSEGIYRSVLEDDVIDPSWRVTLNAGYRVGKNKVLSVIFGRDFDGTVTKDGSLIAALNFVIGFGADKKIQ